MKRLLILFAMGGFGFLALPVKAGDALDDLAWMTGHWRLCTEGRLSEELWTAPKGGLMLGLNRSTRPDKPAQFEFLRIGAVDGKLIYYAQPSGRPPTEFTLSGSGEHWVEFENPAHDYPKRIRYMREGDTLTAEITGDRGSAKWHWRAARHGDECVAE